MNAVVAVVIRHMTMLVLAAVLNTLVLTACGGNQSSAPNAGGQSPAIQTPYTATAPRPAGPEIVISGMAYTLPPSVKPGERITVVNKDDPNHTVTADENNLFDVRVSGGGGISTLTAPDAPGTYPIHCKYHANMHGSLTVQ